MKRRVAILGSTGSIGTQALDVIAQHPDLFEVELLTANNSKDLLIEQAIRFNANTVVIGNKDLYKEVSEALNPHMIKVFAGNDSISDILEYSTNIDIVVASMVGFSGLKPTLAAIRSGKTIALANKETLVAAGEIVTGQAKKHNSFIIPVDSEHSAIFQSLQGERAEIEKILLTASGGPFLDATIEQMAAATKEIALKHPRWNMGAKVTIDSASMMNKGLEMIEARWLFDIEPERIKVVIHPQSIVHSMVEFTDGSVKAQLGNADMHTPISYALLYPERAKEAMEHFSILDYPTLTFSAPDREKYPALDVAYECLERGGTAACTMNGANEVAVAAFLQHRCRYTDIVGAIRYALDNATFVARPTLADYDLSNREARDLAQRYLNR
jgi:1-deoxy-D-xylulose-5-phosphate reductoisomerase